MEVARTNTFIQVDGKDQVTWKEFREFLNSMPEYDDVVIWWRYTDVTDDKGNLMFKHPVKTYEVDSLPILGFKPDNKSHK